MIWLQTLDEYLYKAVMYFRMTSDYLPEIRQLLEKMREESDVLEKDPSLAEPSEENVRGLAAAIHRLAVITAWKEGKKIPEDVLIDYPWLKGEKLDLPNHTYEYSIEKADFETAENFQTFLKENGISASYKVCRQFPLLDSLACYLWQGEEIRIVTVENPLKDDGYCHLIVMQGEMSKVLGAAKYIEQQTGVSGNEGLYIIDFTELYCTDPDPDDNLTDGPPAQPSGDITPNVYELRKFGEFLTDYPLGPSDQKGEPSDTDFNFYRLPWEMTYREFSSYVKRYTKRFGDYPLEVWEVLGLLIRMQPEWENVLKAKPDLGLASKLANPIHIIYLTKAIVQGKHIPSKVLGDYPAIKEIVLKRIPVPDDLLEYGFDATDFKTRQKFKDFLALTGLSPRYQVCHYNDIPEGPAMYLWEGEDINMVTASNPLLTDGYASFIGIAGKKERTMKAVAYIEVYTDSRGSKGLEYIGFKDILCVASEPLPDNDSSAQDFTSKHPDDDNQPAGTENDDETRADESNAPVSWLKRFLTFLLEYKNGFNGYIEGGKAKERFEKLGRKAFTELAEFLEFKQYQVEFDPVEKDHSGSLILTAMLGEGSGVKIWLLKTGEEGEWGGEGMYSAITHMEQSDVILHFFPEEELANPEKIRERIVKLLDQKSSFPRSDEAQIDVPEEEKHSDQEPSPQTQLEAIEKALDAGNSFEAANIVRLLAEQVENGINIELLPHIIRYKQHRDLRRELPHLEIEEIINSEKFREALSINLWNLIPDDYKHPRTIKPISWKADPADKGLRLLMADFVGYNELRPALLGASFNEKGIAATDSHKLLFFNNPNPSRKGIYCVTKFCFKARGKEGAEEVIIPETFPDYVRVLPESLNVVLTLHADAVRIFSHAVRKAQLARGRDPVMVFCYDEGKFIGINIEYFESCAEVFLRLGYSTFEMGFIAPNKAMLLTPPGRMEQVADLATPFILMMPSIIYDGSTREPKKGELYFDCRDESIVTEGIEERIFLTDNTTAIQAPGKQMKTEIAQPEVNIETTLHWLCDNNWFKQHPEKVISTLEQIENNLLTEQAETLPEETLPEKAHSHADDYIDKVVAVMHDKYSKGERVTKKQIEKLAGELNVPSLGKMWEAAELSWLLWYQMLYREPGTFESRLSKMIHFWNNVQTTYAYSDSSKELYRQYSTPCPIAAIVSEYTGMRKARSVFEPSAGNGLLVLGADPSRTHVNEIDPARVESLKFQRFQKITTMNAAQPFQEDMTRRYEVVVTNPPFVKWEDDQFDKDYLVRKYFHNHTGLSKYLRLEHVMAGLALHTMKDHGKAAIIIMGHVYFLKDGFLGKYRPFFNWLYRHYYVDDIINMNSFKLYNKQGAVEKTMLILINGRKAKPQGVAPTKQSAPHLEEMVNTFEELWARVQAHLTSDLDVIISQLKIALYK